jgi:hypothetical protein
MTIQSNQPFYLRLLMPVAASLSLSPFLADSCLASTQSTPLVIERLIFTIIVEADGSSREILHSTDRITSDLGAADYSESYFNYSTSKDHFTVHQAYTLTPDGQRIEVAPNAIRHIDESDDGDAAMFSDSKDVVIVFPNTSVGARMISLTEEHNHTPAYPGHYTQVLSSRDRYITEHAEYRIFLHPNMKLNQHSFGLEKIPFTALQEPDLSLLKSAEEDALAKGYRFMGFRYSNDAVSPKEPDEVDLGEGGTLLLLSSLSGHSALAEQYQSRASGKAVPTPELSKKTHELVAGLQTDIDKAKAIYNWINQNIRYVAIYLGDGGLVPHDAGTVFRNRYGDCKDHVVLFETMLKEVGIGSEAVLVNLGRRYHLPSVALTYPFNHVITYIPSLGIYADPTAQFASFGTLPFEVADKPVVHTVSADVRRTPVYQPKDNFGGAKIKMTVLDDGRIQGEVAVRVSGNTEIDSRWLAFERLDSDPKKVAEGIFAMNRELGAGRILTSNPRDMSKPFEVSSQFTLESHIDLPGPGAFPLPVGLSPGMLAKRVIRKPLEDRTKPFACEPELIEEHIQLNLGGNLRVSRIPNDTDYHQGPISYESRYTISESESGQTLEVRRVLKVSPTSHVCSIETHNYFKELFGLMRKDLRQLIFYQ